MNQLPVQTDKHAEFSPSQLPRIVSCPGSYQASKEQPNPSSPFAEEGTMLHEVMAYLLRLAALPQQVGDYEFGPDVHVPFNLDDEQRECISKLLSWVGDTKEMLGDFGYTELIEYRVDLTYLDKVYPEHAHLLKEISGTADYILIVPEIRTIIVADWKFGRGVEVFATSDQLKAYALGAIALIPGRGPHCTKGTPAQQKSSGLLALDHTERGWSLEVALSEPWMVKAVIGQPRIKMDVEEHTYIVGGVSDSEGLFPWLQQEVLPSLESATSNHPRYNSDESGACRFCRAVGCRARYEARLKDVEEIVKAEERNGRGLPVSVEEKVEILQAIRRVENYGSVVQGELMSALMRGVPVPGMKLVKGRAYRLWAVPENTVVSELTSKFGLSTQQCYAPPKLVSPAQAEKVVPKMIKKSPEFTSLIKKGDGKPTMVLESDKRPALSVGDIQSVGDIDFGVNDDDLS